MAKRYFTADEASGALAAVRPLAQRMVEHRHALVGALEKQERLRTLVAANGGKLRPQEFVRVQAEVEEEAAGIARCVEGIRELGGLVKDVDRGLVDFPALRGDEEVLLCWQLGEDEIRYWHGLEEGFAARKELPL